MSREGARIACFEEPTIRRKLPRTLGIYALKGLVGKMFNLQPMSLKLIWETGELDPPPSGHNEDDEEWGYREIPDFKAVGAVPAPRDFTL